MPPENNGNRSADPLTESWMALVNAPEEPGTNNRFAHELLLLVRRIVRTRYHIPLLRSELDDLCQDACLLLISTLLAGNQDLLEATRAGKISSVGNELRRSVYAAVRFATWKMIRKHRLESRSMNEGHRLEAMCQHPANFSQLHEISIAAQQALVLAMLDEAVSEGQLPEESAELARTLIDQGITQADLARALTISRQAVCQRLAPVWRHLRAAISQQEFPNL